MAPKAEAKKDAKKKEAKKKDVEDPDEAKIPVVEAPDKKGFEDKLEKLQKKIDDAQAKLKEVKDQIGDRSQGNSEFQSKRAELLAKVQAEKEKIDEYMAEKDKIRGAMGLKNEEDKKMKGDLKDMKKKLGYTDIGQIDARIREIEDVMMHSVISLKEEKKMMLEIAQLKKNKPEVTKFKEMDQKIATNRELNSGNNSTLKEQLDQLNEVMNVHRERKKELNAEFTLIIQERDAQMGNSQEMYAQRDELNGKVKEYIQERNELRDAFRQDERKYYEYQRELKNLRWEKQREERERNEKEWQQERRKRDAEKLDDQPFVSETTLLEQTIKFCKTFQPKEAEEKAEVKEIVHTNKKDEEVLVSKKTKDEEYYYAPTRKPKASKNKNKAAGASSTAKPIKHNAETFKLFASLKIDAPITTDDIPAVLEKLEAEMATFQGKIKEWELKRDERKAKIMAGEKDEDEEEEKAEEKEEA